MPTPSYNKYSQRVASDRDSATCWSFKHEQEDPALPSKRRPLVGGDDGVVTDVTKGGTRRAWLAGCRGGLSPEGGGATDGWEGRQMPHLGLGKRAWKKYPRCARPGTFIPSTDSQSRKFSHGRQEN